MIEDITMKTVNIKNIEIKGKSLIIREYYNKCVVKNADEKIGILKELPDIEPINIWSPKQWHSKNWFMFMYNNEFMPHAESAYKPGRGYVLCGALDASKANRKPVVGCMKDIWKDFEKECMQDLDFNHIDMQKVEDDFWAYYITHYGDKFQTGVNILEEFVMSKRALMTEEERAKEKEVYPFLDDDDLWRRGCTDYLEYLLKVNTVRGFVMELVLFTTLADLTGGTFIESNAKNEAKGIDGFILWKGFKYPVCLKPNTFNGGISPVYEDRLVKYSKRNNDLYFTFTTGENLLKEAQQAAGL